MPRVLPETEEEAQAKAAAQIQKPSPVTYVPSGKIQMPEFITIAGKVCPLVRRDLEGVEAKTTAPTASKYDEEADDFDRFCERAYDILAAKYGPKAASFA
ncbi:hypothetical protein SAMN05444156_2158 [Verrucomicrobium sp. GAS474]|uniref:hypothetical protein n=1 Tax=Verrucomicrobium sp. GAS474 TaxID=1882831 RepID=UPI00087C2EB0|nr:hypothetical protein [Verrucomicrobium sp. GAS474]SDU13360.1 hypothetical protein SAMN05444156_2158 [Verrucomicrobium sp. GAS474]